MDPTTSPTSFASELVNLLSNGIAGLIVGGIVLPILKWVFGEMRETRRDSKAQQDSFMTFISSHAQREQELIADLKSKIERETEILTQTQNSKLIDTSTCVADIREEVRRLREALYTSSPGKG